MGAYSGPELVDDGLVLALDAAPNPRYVDYAGRGANFSANGDYLTIADSNVFSPGTGDYTIEGWFRWTSNGWYNRLVSGDDGSSTSWYIYTFRNNEPAIFVNGSYMNPTISPVFVYNQWYHLAVSRVSGTTYFFRDGVLLQSSTNANINGSITSSNVRICTSLTNAQQFYGDVSNVRIVVGDGLASHYTSAFTPPTEPLTAVSGTTLLLCQNGSFTKDNSGYNRTVTTNGSPAKSSLDLGTPFGDWFNLANNTGIGTLTNGPVFTQEPKLEPFGGAGAVSFDGSGDYLNISSHSDHDLGSGDFTVEGWFKTSATIADQAIIQKYYGPANYNGWGILLDSAGTGLRAAVFNGSNVQVDLFGGSNLNDGAWHHFALSRSGTDLRLFVDGALTDSTTNSFNITATEALRIGRDFGNSSRDWNGQMSNIRILKGTALYTSNFTPKRQPLIPESAPNTVLLTCQKGPIRDRSSSAHAITINGNAKSISGASYFEFDGTDDYVTAPNNADFDFGSGDFTVEYWINFSTVSGIRGIFGKRVSEVNYAPILMYLQSSALQLLMSTSGSSWNVSLSTSTLSTGSWNHVAVFRSGTTVYLFLNGTSIGSTGTVSGALISNTAPLTVGVDSTSPSGSTPLNGYISNFRIYKGKALTAEEVEQNYNALKGRFGL